MTPFTRQKDSMSYTRYRGRTRPLETQFDRRGIRANDTVKHDKKESRIRTGENDQLHMITQAHQYQVGGGQDKLCSCQNT
jgi:hypothetical protein